MRHSNNTTVERDSSKWVPGVFALLLLAAIGLQPTAGAALTLGDSTTMVFLNAIPKSTVTPPATIPTEPTVGAGETRLVDDSWVSPLMNNSYNSNTNPTGTEMVRWSMDVTTPETADTITRFLIPGGLDYYGFNDTIQVSLSQGASTLWTASGTGSGSNAQWWADANSSDRTYYGWLEVDLATPIDVDPDTLYTFELAGIESGVSGAFNLRMWLNSTTGGGVGDSGGTTKTIDNMTIDGTIIPEPASMLLGLSGLALLALRRSGGR